MLKYNVLKQIAWKLAASLWGIILIIGMLMINYGVVGVCGVICMLLFISAYYGLVAQGIIISGSYSFIRNMNKKDVLLCIFGCLSILTVVYALIAREKFIYYWDYSGFWTATLAKGGEMMSSPIESLKWLYIGICNDEYNKWIPMIIALPLKILGGTYLSYVLVMMIMFVLPTAFIYALVLQHMRFNKNIPIGIAFCLFAGMVALIFPTMIGYADAACILLVSVLVLIAVTLDFQRYSLKNCIVISAIILHLALMRRSYCIWIISYAIALVSRMLYESIICKAAKNGVVNYIKNLLTIFAICSIMLLLFFEKYVTNILQSNIFVSYGAWGKITEVGKYLKFVDEYGIVMLVFSICSLACFRKNRGINCRVVLVQFMTVLPLIIYMLILGTGFTVNAFYWISGQLCLLQIIGLFEIVEQISQAGVKKIISTIFVIAYSLNFIVGIGFLNIDSMHLLQNRHYSIRRRDDIDEIKRLVFMLSKLSDGNKTVYVIASSNILNDDIARNAYLPEVNSNLNLLYTAHADLRDGFPISFLTADVVVVTNPLQFHLMPEDQRVISILGDFVENETQTYQKLPETYALRDDVEAMIYVRTAPLSSEQIRQLGERFELYYSEYPNLFSGRVKNFMENVMRNDVTEN